MECTLGLFGPSATSGSVSLSAINDSNASTMDILHNDFVGKAPIEPSPSPSSSALDLGLALALGGGGQVSGGVWADRARILTAQDFPLNGSVSVSGTKRAADSAPIHGGSSTAINQVVGWPPIRTYRMNSFVNQAKTARAEQDDDGVSEENKDQSKDNKTCDVDGKGNMGFVKVNVDGVVIGRKVDLSAHSCYETLAFMLEDMFFRSPGAAIPNGHSGDKEQARKLSKLLDGCSEFVLTYEDREGDWMLVGDVPWGNVASHSRSNIYDVSKLGSKTSYNENIRSQRTRYRISSSCTQLPMFSLQMFPKPSFIAAPRSQDKKLKQRSKPI